MRETPRANRGPLQAGMARALCARDASLAFRRRQRRAKLVAAVAVPVLFGVLAAACGALLEDDEDGDGGESGERRRGRWDGDRWGGDWWDGNRRDGRRQR